MLEARRISWFLTLYPSYCMDRAYKMPVDLVSPLYQRSKTPPFFWIDDVYIRKCHPNTTRHYAIPNLEWLCRRQEIIVLWQNGYITLRSRIPLHKTPKTEFYIFTSTLSEYRKYCTSFWYDQINKVQGRMFNLENVIWNILYWK